MEQLVLTRRSRSRPSERVTPATRGDCLLRLAEVMEDEGFRSFFDEYFSEWSDIKAMIMLMKAYQFLDQEYQRLSGGQRLSRERLCFFLRRVLMNTELRAQLTDTMDHFMSANADFGKTCHRLLEAEFSRQAALMDGLSEDTRK